MLVGDDGGRYPSGNSLVVRGDGEAVIIDPRSRSSRMGGAPVDVDAVILSHSHEDHMAGNGLYSRHAPAHPRRRSARGAQPRRADGRLRARPASPGRRSPGRSSRSSTTPRAPTPRVSATVTCGISAARRSRRCTCPVTRVATAASGFRMACSSCPTSTSPGSARTTATCGATSRTSSARSCRSATSTPTCYVTFHHQGVIEGREEFLRLLDEFHAVIARRHEAMLEFLAEPHTIEEMAAHRFIYRPHVQHVFADSVERRCAAMHVQRMLIRGEANEVEPRPASKQSERSASAETAAWYSAIRARWPSTSVGSPLWVAIARCVAPSSRHVVGMRRPAVGSCRRRIAPGRGSRSRPTAARPLRAARSSRAMRSATFSPGLPSGIHPSPMRGTSFEQRRRRTAEQHRNRRRGSRQDARVRRSCGYSPPKLNASSLHKRRITVDLLLLAAAAGMEVLVRAPRTRRRSTRRRHRA